VSGGKTKKKKTGSATAIASGSHDEDRISPSPRVFGSLAASGAGASFVSSAEAMRVSYRIFPSARMRM
jgi:hypothetical protein